MSEQKKHKCSSSIHGVCIYCHAEMPNPDRKRNRVNQSPMRAKRTHFSDRANYGTVTKGKK